jgi:hypothetical protein
MLLPSNRGRVLDQRRERLVELFRAIEAKRVHVVIRRDELDPAEARMSGTTLEPQVRVEQSRAGTAPANLTRT